MKISKSISVDKEDLVEIMAVASEIDRDLSWVIRSAWRIARPRIFKLVEMEKEAQREKQG